MANRYLITGGGSVVWDAVDTSIWSGISGGGGGASVPGAGDDVIMDGASGGGTVTLGYTPNVKSISMGAFTGTFNGSTYGAILTPATTALSFSGTGVRTVNLGSGTYEVRGYGGTYAVTAQTATNLTFNAGTSRILFHSMAASSAISTFTLTNGGKTWNTIEVQIDDSIFSGYYPILSLNGTNGTINSLIVEGHTTIKNQSSRTTTFNSMVLNSSLATPITIQPITAATSCTWIYAGEGVVGTDYLTISYCVASAANKFYAGTHSTDGGGNTDWSFTDPPGVPYGQSSVMVGNNI
jgi:hypothetical protein